MPKCEYCEREFATEAALAQHRRDKHGEGPAAPLQERTGHTGAVKKQKSLRRRNRHPVAIGIAVAIVVAGLGIYLLAAPSSAQPPFPCSTEGAYDHVHPYLQIWVDGANVSIPSGVGLLNGGACTEPVHTHDSSGILHLELSQSQAGQSWTLSDFFSIWKFSCSQAQADCPTVNGTSRPVVFNQTDILGYRADSGHRVVLLVDGVSSTQWGGLPLLQYDYCSASVANVFPCAATAGGDPAWQCLTSTQCANYPYGTGHKIIIEFVPS